MNGIVELTAKYKMGHTQLTTPTGVYAKGIMRVERVPEEIPEQQDGSLSRVIMINEMISVAEDFETVMKRWGEALKEDDL